MKHTRDSRRHDEAATEKNAVTGGDNENVKETVGGGTEESGAPRSWKQLIEQAMPGYPYIKRFIFEPTTKPQRYLGENTASSLRLLSSTQGARFRVTFGGDDNFREPLEIDAWDFIGVKSVKARGKRLTTFTIGTVEEIEPRAIPEADEPSASIGDNAISDDDETNDETFHETSDEEVRDEINGQTRIF